MSVEKFIEQLSLMGYPNMDKFTTDSCAWLFKNQDLELFLKFICSHVQPENMLQAKEIEEFSAMVDAGEEILNHQQVESIQDLCDVTMIASSQSEQAKEVAKLQEELKKANRRNSKLNALKSYLSSEYSTISSRASTLDALDRTISNELRRLDGKSRVTSKLVDKTMARTLHSFVGIDEILGITKQANPLYLTYLSLNDVFEADKVFKDELEGCLFKYFENLSDAHIASSWQSKKANRNDSWQTFELSCSQWEDMDENDKFKEALDGIGKLHVAHQTKCIASRVKEKSLLRTVQAAEAILKSIKQRQFQTNESSIRLKLSSANDNLVAKETALERSRHRIAEQVERNVQITLHSKKVERCDEIISKKQNIISNLDTIISHLLNQSAQYQFLRENLIQDLERMRNQPIEHTLSVFRLRNTAFKSRMNAMRELKIIAERHGTCIDEALLKCFIDILHPGRIATETNSLDSICDEVETLNATRDRLQQSRIVCLRKLTSRLHEMSECITNLQGKIWKDCPSPNDLPLLSPKVLIDAKIDLQNTCSRLTERLHCLDLSFKDRVKLVRSDPKLQRARCSYLDLCGT